MSDNRPLVGYAIVHTAMGPQSWNHDEGRLATTEGAQLFKSLGDANRALNATIEFSIRRNFGWKVSDYLRVRVVRSRRAPEFSKGVRT